uniref:AAA domain-containing protein n=1 Tax=Syphacia muris TaxID=451379 RepID=A0A0N5AAL7_9BILA
MSSSKKKKVTVKCTDCDCYVLTKDLEKHKLVCGSNNDVSEIQFVSTNDVLVAVEQAIEKWETCLPPEVFGWTKYHSVLVHPETMIQLGIVPRQPCIYEKKEVNRIVIVWPCDMVSAYFCEIFCCYRVIFIIYLPDFVFYREYIRTFLSGSYLMQEEVVQVPFYGTLCEFSPEHTLTKQMEDLSLSESSKQVMKMTSKFVVSIVENFKRTVTESKLSLADFGGNKSVKNYLVDLLITPFRGCKGVSLIITGISGTGKSLLLRILTAELGSKAFVYNDDVDFDEQLSYLKTDKACCLLIDNFDHMMEKLSSFMDKHDNVSVVLVVQNIDKVSISLRRRFILELELTVPSFYERLKAFKIKVVYFVLVFSNTHGFTGSDLESILKLLSVSEEIILQRLNDAVRQIHPTGLREIVLEVPNVSWDDIGGYTDLKDIIKQTILWPQLFPESFARFNIPAPSGILLYGPPGCCKTMVARALAAQSKLNFLAVKGPEIFSKWVGESERAVRELFRRARQVAPSILFFDEIDAVAVNRGDKSNSGVGDRVLAQLLTELDGLEKKSGVVVLAATNRPDMLDSALLRPGRLDRAIYVTLPDDSARLSILMLQLKNVRICEDVDLDSIVHRTEGYSGAEIVAVYRNAALIALRENKDAECLNMSHFLKSLKEVVPRTDHSMIKLYEAFEKGSQI